MSRENDHPMTDVYIPNDGGSRATSNNEDGGVELEKQISHLRRENHRLRQQRNEADNDNDRLRRQRNDAEVEVSRLRRKFDDAFHAMEKLKTKVADERRYAKDFREDEVSRLRRKYDDALHAMEKLKTELADERRELKFYRESNDQKSSKICWLEEELRKKELDVVVMQKATDRLRDDNDRLIIVRKVLWESWDPIRMRDIGGPSDEYDSYAPFVEIMLKKGCGRETIAEHLSDVQTKQIGVTANHEKNLQVADILLAKIGSNN